MIKIVKTMAGETLITEIVSGYDEKTRNFGDLCIRHPIQIERVGPTQIAMLEYSIGVKGDIELKQNFVGFIAEPDDECLAKYEEYFGLISVPNKNLIVPGV